MFSMIILILDGPVKAQYRRISDILSNHRLVIWKFGHLGHFGYFIKTNVLDRFRPNACQSVIWSGIG